MTPRVRQTLLWVSVGLNVAFAASLTAVALFPSALAEPLGLGLAKHHKHPEPGPAAGARGGDEGRGDRGGSDWFLTGTIKRAEERLALTPEQKTVIEERSGVIRQSSRDAFTEMRDQRKRMMQVIVLHPDDEAKFQAVKVENRTAWDMFSDELLEGLRDIVLELTPEQRAILAEELNKPPAPPVSNDKSKSPRPPDTIPSPEK